MIVSSSMHECMYCMYVCKKTFPRSRPLVNVCMYVCMYVKYVFMYVCTVCAKKNAKCIFQSYLITYEDVGDGYMRLSMP